MKLKCLACEALARLVYAGASCSPHIVDVELFRLGLHNEPGNLRDCLQAHIDATAKAGYDALLLAYGLCGKATAGLTAREIPLVIPRAHDCITLFLGSRKRYLEQFENHPGTYWYVTDYIQRNSGAGIALGWNEEINAREVYDAYVQKFGQDNADYLMSVMGAWKSHYQRAAFIDMNTGDSREIEQQAREEAQRRGWQFEKLRGDATLIQRLLMGDWEQDFLVVNPGEQITMTFDGDILVSCRTA